MNLKKLVATPNGKILKTFTNSEILEMAKNGDDKAIHEIAKDEFNKALNTNDKLNAIAKALRLI